MKQEKNITFFTGAGASYHACPIWEEQGEKMIELANLHFEEEMDYTEFKHEYSDDEDELMHYMGYFGKKAIEFGTIDTYARKLYLNSKHFELNKLKFTISAFFSIWHYIDNPDLKKRKINGVDSKFSDIDIRYTQLFATILKKDTNNINLKDNVKFVTWNYDLQLEYAIQSFYAYISDLDTLSKNIHFKHKQDNLQICHLNGYNGYYTTKDSENSLLDRTNERDLKSILKAINFANKAVERRQIIFSNHINYAWENNKYAEKTRQEAEKIFSKTDILVIIGYSFPNFNKEIDKKLFSCLKENVKVYFQDPQASEDYIKHLITTPFEYVILKDKVNSFHLPYEF